jgi:AraC-like DNA-binding protein
MHSGETQLRESDLPGKYSIYTDIYVAAERLDFDGVIVVHDYEGSLNPLMHMIMKTTTEKENNYSSIADSLLEVVCQYIKKYRGVSYRYPFIAEFKNLMYDNISNADFNISDNVREMGFSLDYFRRCFSSEIGVTPLEYLTGLRIEEAKKLLAQSYMSVAEVASRCGFTDSYYFSNKFHREVGVTPRDYMKSFVNKKGTT